MSIEGRAATPAFGARPLRPYVPLRCSPERKRARDGYPLPDPGATSITWANSDLQENFGIFITFAHFFELSFQRPFFYGADHTCALLADTDAFQAANAFFVVSFRQ